MPGSPYTISCWSGCRNICFWAQMSSTNSSPPRTLDQTCTPVTTDSQVTGGEAEKHHFLPRVATQRPKAKTHILTTCHPKLRWCLAIREKFCDQNTEENLPVNFEVNTKLQRNPYFKQSKGFWEIEELCGLKRLHATRLELSQTNDYMSQAVQKPLTG